MGSPAATCYCFSGVSLRRSAIQLTSGSERACIFLIKLLLRDKGSWRKQTNAQYSCANNNSPGASSLPVGAWRKGHARRGNAITTTYGYDAFGCRVLQTERDHDRLRVQGSTSWSLSPLPLSQVSSIGFETASDI
jgi:hypothetical protein